MRMHNPCRRPSQRSKSRLISLPELRRFLLLIVAIGILVLIAVSILVIVRSVMSLLNAQKHAPMPNPGSWLV